MCCLRPPLEILGLVVVESPLEVAVVPGGSLFLWKMLVRRSSAAVVALSFYENGIFGAGFWGAAINRCSAAATTPADVFCGTLQLCGKNLTVWAIHSTRLFGIYTRWH